MSFDKISDVTAGVWLNLCHTYEFQTTVVYIEKLILQCIAEH